ncbi:MAG: ABC transporter ATP-binding protein [Myxococcota bacterium]
MAVVFDNISHAYGATRVLRHLNFEVKAGEITCLLGPSGGGKSTLLRLAAGLEPLQAGTIQIDGVEVASARASLAPERRPIGMMFQENALFPHMTVAQNIAFGLSGLRGRPREARVAELLALVDMVAFGQRRPHELSGGQQQRVALVRSLAPNPSVLLMDEPYNSIDSTLRRSLREAARRTLRAQGTTAIMVTHDPAEAMEMADVIAVLDEGRILQVGAPQEIFEHPRAATVAALFGEAQGFEARATAAGFETPYGLIAGPTGGGGDGACSVVVRPHGVELRPGGAEDVTISDIRFVGEGWLAFVETRTMNPRDVPLRVFLDRVDAWRVSDRVSLHRADRGFFVFRERD